MTDPTDHLPSAPQPSGRHRRPGRFDALARLRGRRTRPETPEPDGPDRADRADRADLSGAVSRSTGSPGDHWARTDGWPPADGRVPDDTVLSADPWGPRRAAHPTPPRPVWSDALPAWAGPARPEPSPVVPHLLDGARGWDAVEPERSWGSPPGGRGTLPAPRAAGDLGLPPVLRAVPPVTVPVARPERAGHLAGPTDHAPVDRRPNAAWARLQLSDGRTLTLLHTALVGRDPAPRVGESPGTLVAVSDPGRSVSKTHLGVGVDAGGAWVVDRQSTNGTVVTLPDGQQILCVPERVVRLAPGASVTFGDHGFTLVAVHTRTATPDQHPDQHPDLHQEHPR